MTKPADDLEAVRTISDTLEPFPDDDRERILRWVREKLGMSGVSTPGPAAPHTVASESPLPESPPVHPSASSSGGTPQMDIRSFVAEKDPRNDIELAATVAYFYQFVAPEDAQKESITGNDLVEACRAASRPRPARPAQTLGNAFTAGVLDRGAHGQYRLNAVGENLVAMVLPDSDGESKARRTANRKRSPARKKVTKKAAKKKAAKKKKTAKKKASKKKSGR